MGADVDAGGLGSRQPIVETGEGTGAPCLVGEIDDGRRPTERGGHRAGTERVRGMRGSEFPVQMGVHIDSTWKHQKVRCIDGTRIRTNLEVPADRPDPPVVNQNVGGVVVD